MRRLNPWVRPPISEVTILIDSDSGHLIDHVNHSVGGFGGHAFRRITHISMAVIPILYYQFGEEITSYLSLEPEEFVSAACLTLLIIEALRLRFGIVIVGQREYESNQISALAWGTLAVSLTLLIAPGGEGKGLESGLYGIPIIFGLTFVDPVMGEIKRIKRDMKSAIYAGMAVSYAVWIGCHFWIGTDLLAAVLLAPLTVVGEIPSTKIIDDNATMVLLPLAGLVLLMPFL